MTSQGRSPRANDDGVRIVRTAGARRLSWLIAAAVAVPVVVTILAVALIRASSGPAARTAPPTPPVAVAVASTDAPPAAGAATAASPSVRPREAVVPRRVVTAPVEDRPAPGAMATPAAETSAPRELDAGDAIRALREEGIHTGIAAFGLPGTDPPKSGIIVPEDFPLPEGYVRHYQTTDDGESLPAILMFHPDYEFLDGRGRVVRVPDDRVVPRDMAPPGLDPDRVLRVPERKVGEPVH